VTRVKRPTIADVARHAGVSKGSVSYALNGRPGVSAETRARIMSAADLLGWQPNSAARALSGARADAVALVLARPARTLGAEMFYMQLISGIETELSRRSVALVLQVVDDLAAEVQAYRRLSAQHRVDGVFLTDLREHDPRVTGLIGLGLPAVVIGGRESHPGMPRVWSDDAAAMRDAVRYLAALGHRRITRVAGPPDFLHTQIRTAAFHVTVAELGITEHTVATDFTGLAGAAATRAVLSGSPRPTALLYDNDVMAVAGCAVAREMGVDIPRDLSIIAWDDSVLCQLVHPPLTAVSRDASAFGGHAAVHLLALIAGEPVGDLEDSAPQLVPRGSTGPPSPDR